MPDAGSKARQIRWTLDKTFIEASRGKLDSIKRDKALQAEAGITRQAQTDRHAQAGRGRNRQTGTGR